MYQFTTIPGIEPTTPFFKTGRDLGPRQIEWLKKNVPQFGPAKEAADRVKAHEAEIKAQMPAPAPSAAS